MTSTKFKRLVGRHWLSAPMALIPDEIKSTMKIECANCKAEMLLANRDRHAARCLKKAA